MQKAQLKRLPISAQWFQLLMIAFILLSGCREAAMAPDAEPVRLPVKMVWAGYQGGGQSPAPSVQWIDGPENLNTTQLQRSPIRAVVERGSMDWAHYGLVWIRMGQKPTGGFGLRLTESEAMVRRGAAVVTVQWREPPKGAFVTQMITSPNMLLKLPRGDYNEIVIQDRIGTERAATAIQP